MRLVGGLSSTDGRVEVFYNGAWGSICDNGWDMDDALVVCRALGFTDVYGATSAAEFGQGSGDVVFDDVRCVGNESSLWECPHGELGVSPCTHAPGGGGGGALTFEKGRGVRPQNLKPYP